jgi:hypothetical protein
MMEYARARFEEVLSWLMLRADLVDKTLVGLIGLGLAIALLAAIVPARKYARREFSDR